MAHLKPESKEEKEAAKKVYEKFEAIIYKINQEKII